MATKIEIDQCRLEMYLRVYTEPCPAPRVRMSQSERDGLARPKQIEGVAMQHEGRFAGIYTPKGTDLKFFTMEVVSDKPVYQEKNGVIEKIIGYKKGKRRMYIPMKTITKIELIKIRKRGNPDSAGQL